MGKLSTKNKWVQIICGILLAAVGLAVFILGIVAPGNLEYILGGLVGLVCVLYGLLLILVNVIGNKDQKFPIALATGSLAIAVGCIFAAVVPEVLGDALIWFVGILLAMLGICLVIRGVYLLIRKIKIGWFLLFVIGGVVVLAAGVLAVVGVNYEGWNMEWLPQTIYCVLGVIICFIGIYLVVANCRKKKSA